MSKFSIKFGERIQSDDHSVRTYFFAATPTGETVKIMENTHVRKLNMRKLLDPEAIEGRLFQIDFEIKRPMVLAMICITTRLGYRRRSEKIIFEIGDDDFPEIEICGFNEFGGFRGRAKIPDKLPEGVTYKVIKIGKGGDKNEPNHGLIW